MSSNGQSASRPENVRVSPETVRALADEGLGRNAVMRRLGATKHAVDTAAREAGVTWDRSHTREAVRAMVADAQIEREELSADVRKIARTVVDKILSADHLDATELRELTWSLGSLIASDARLGKLAVEAMERRVPGASMYEELDDEDDTATGYLDMLTTFRRQHGRELD